MNKYSYQIPRTLAGQFSFQQTLGEFLAKKATSWGISEETVNLYTTQSSDYETKYKEADNSQTRSPALTRDRNASWKILVGTINSIYKSNLLYNTAISPKDQEALHIYEINAGGRTPYEAQSVAPSVVLTTEGIASLYVNYSTSGASSSHRKPAGVAFCEVACKIGDVPPLSADECPNHYHISRSHQEILFSPQQRGSQVYAYARWVNHNGKSGPWGSQLMAIIP